MPDGAESTMALATDFPAHSREDWQRLVAAVLNKTRAADAHLDGAQAEASMRSTLAGDVTIDPLYLQPSSPAPVGVPGAMPFTRGRVLRDSAAAWDVRQWHDDPDLDASRAAVLADLEHGVTSVWVQVGADGIPAAGLATVLADVHFDLAPVAVTSWDDQAGASAALLALLAPPSAWGARRTSRSSRRRSKRAWAGVSCGRSRSTHVRCMRPERMPSTSWGSPSRRG